MLVGEGPLGFSTGGQRGPGRLIAPQEGSLKGTGAGCPPVPQDEPMGKMTGMDEQGAFPEAPGEKENLIPLEEGIGNSGRVQRSC